MEKVLHLVVALAIAAVATSKARADDTTLQKSDASSSAVVDCYDAARDTVARVLASECHGKIVSEEEARAIREKRESQVKRALSRRGLGSTDGLRMVSLGTGFYTDDSGHLLTNNHVVDHCNALTARVGIDDEISAQVAAIDAALDLALLKANTETGATAEFPAAGTVLPDTFVAIIGYPDQGLPPLEPLATPGKVLQSAVNIGGSNHIVMRADLRHGNSGGPIFDRLGRVVGIVNAKLNSAAYYSATGLNLTDIGLGIPGRAIVEFLRRNGASHEESRGGEALTLAEILTRARGFVVRIECWR